MGQVGLTLDRTIKVKKQTCHYSQVDKLKW